jgi:hypothetical protein
MPERDFLQEMIDSRTARNPEFPRLLGAARRRREPLRAPAQEREKQAALGDLDRRGETPQ